MSQDKLTASLRDAEPLVVLWRLPETSLGRAAARASLLSTTTLHEHVGGQQAPQPVPGLLIDDEEHNQNQTHFIIEHSFHDVDSSDDEAGLHMHARGVALPQKTTLMTRLGWKAHHRLTVPFQAVRAKAPPRPSYQGLHASADVGVLDPTTVVIASRNLLHVSVDRRRLVISEFGGGDSPHATLQSVT